LLSQRVKQVDSYWRKSICLQLRISNQTQVNAQSSKVHPKLWL